MDIREIHEKLRKSPLSHPTRLALMTLLVARHSLEYNEAVKALGVTPCSLWGHVKMLEKRGLLETRYRLTRNGPRLVLQVTDEGIRETIEVLRLLRRLAGELDEE